MASFSICPGFFSPTQTPLKWQRTPKLSRPEIGHPYISLCCLRISDNHFSSGGKNTGIHAMNAVIPTIKHMNEHGMYFVQWDVACNYKHKLFISRFCLYSYTTDKLDVTNGRHKRLNNKPAPGQFLYLFYFKLVLSQKQNLLNTLHPSSKTMYPSSCCYSWSFFCYQAAPTDVEGVWVLVWRYGWQMLENRFRQAPYVALGYRVWTPIAHGHCHAIQGISKQVGTRDGGRTAVIILILFYMRGSMMSALAAIQSSLLLEPILNPIHSILLKEWHLSTRRYKFKLQ